ncbi:MAG: ABC transporter ATP-binding protein [Acidimicrobiales bacterium]
MTAVLRVERLEATYGHIRALRGVDIHVDEGEAVAILGANGAGKTTLLRTIAGLHRPRRGRVYLDERNVTGWPAERLVRAGLSLVPEGRQVFPALSVGDNLLLGGYRRRRSGAIADDLDRVEQLFPVLAARRSQPAGTLSGGEQQMLAIGRGLLAAPRILLLDEPSLGLAPLAVREVVAKLVEIAATGTTVLVVEQNARAAMKIAPRCWVMQRGRIVLEGSTDELLANPTVQAAYFGGALEQIAGGTGRTT